MASPSSSSGSSNPFAMGAVAINASTAQLISIKSHVPVVLDLVAANYGTWRTFFTNTLKKFGLLDHVDGSVDAQLQVFDPEWTQIDTCVVSWIYATLSDDLLSAVIQPDDTAHSVWSAIATQFLDNVVQRTSQARQQLHALSQGDMNVVDYCVQIKRQGDILRDLGSPLTDQELVITLLGGLSDKLAHCAPTISASGMRFLQARSFLHQEEIWIADRARKVTSTALLAASRSSNASGNVPATGSAAPPPVSNNTTVNSGGERSRKRKKQSTRTGGVSNTPTPTLRRRAAATCRPR
ncbi:uncharacterized protein LOC120710200 [Panicum virgatum]|uniref:uncharacterized protein LOC120710200 n=1 Tax=Panicum virgatum TaxID=38727 RepID=UPI0019D63B05|nr:uncharacterized protein LOC120710200 [Panicum virgatum]